MTEETKKKKTMAKEIGTLTTIRHYVCTNSNQLIRAFIGAKCMGVWT